MFGMALTLNLPINFKFAADGLSARFGDFATDLAKAR